MRLVTRRHDPSVDILISARGADEGASMRAATLGTCTKILVVLTAVILLAGIASANISGAIFTSNGDGTTVNGNKFATKAEVYLNGGPQNEHANGIQPDGLYYFQVT